MRPERTKKPVLLNDDFHSFEDLINKGKDFRSWDIVSGTDEESLVRLLQTVESADASGELATVIGIFGGWGSGKTSVLKGAYNYFKKYEEKHVIPVYYEAWRYFKEENPVVPLMLELKKVVSKGRNAGKIKGKITSALKKILIASAHSIHSEIGIPGVGEFDFNKFASELLKGMKIANNIDGEMKNLFKEILEFYNKENKTDNFRLLILIDDTDRLLPENAAKLFESIRFYFDAKNVITVMALDEEKVGNYLESVYALANGGKENKNLFNGRQFLRKLVQYVVEIPGLDYAHAKGIFKKIFDENDMSKEFERAELWLSNIPPAPYRVWKHIANRIVMDFYQAMSKGRIPDIRSITIFSILKECFVDAKSGLENNFVIKEEISKEFLYYYPFIARGDLTLERKIVKFKKFMPSLWEEFLSKLENKENVWKDEKSVWEVLGL